MAPEAAPTSAQATSLVSVIEADRAITVLRTDAHVAMACAIISGPIAGLLFMGILGKLLFAAVCDGCGQNHWVEALVVSAAFALVSLGFVLSLRRYWRLARLATRPSS
jgi:hypothetical protein